MSGLEWTALCHLSVSKLGMQDNEGLANQRYLSGINEVGMPDSREGLMTPLETASVRKTHPYGSMCISAALVES